MHASLGPELLPGNLQLRAQDSARGHHPEIGRISRRHVLRAHRSPVDGSHELHPHVERDPQRRIGQSSDAHVDILLVDHVRQAGDGSIDLEVEMGVVELVGSHVDRPGLRVSSRIRNRIVLEIDGDIERQGAVVSGIPARRVILDVVVDSSRIEEQRIGIDVPLTRVPPFHIAVGDVEGRRVDLVVYGSLQIHVIPEDAVGDVEGTARPRDIQSAPVARRHGVGYNRVVDDPGPGVDGEDPSAVIVVCPVVADHVVHHDDRITRLAAVSEVETAAEYRGGVVVDDVVLDHRDIIVGIFAAAEDPAAAVVQGDIPLDVVCVDHRAPLMDGPDSPARVVGRVADDLVSIDRGRRRKAGRPFDVDAAAGPLPGGIDENPGGGVVVDRVEMDQRIAEEDGDSAAPPMHRVAPDLVPDDGDIVAVVAEKHPAAALAGFVLRDDVVRDVGFRVSAVDPASPGFGVVVPDRVVRYQNAVAVHAVHAVDPAAVRLLRVHRCRCIELDDVVVDRHEGLAAEDPAAAGTLAAAHIEARSIPDCEIADRRRSARRLHNLDHGAARLWRSAVDHRDGRALRSIHRDALAQEIDAFGVGSRVHLDRVPVVGGNDRFLDCRIIVRDLDDSGG